MRPYRDRLDALYRSSASDADKRAGKAALMIELRADKTTQYKQIAEAMDKVKNAGIRKLGFITEPSK